AHVREVEQAGRAANRLVLGDLAAVPQGHQPASETGHGGAEALVDRAQRRGPELAAAWLRLVARHHQGATPKLIAAGPGRARPGAARLSGAAALSGATAPLPPPP